MSDDHLTSEEIEVILLRHMPRGRWLAVSELYAVVELHGSLSPADWQPDAPGSVTGIRWRRNVRNVLQRRKSRVAGAASGHAALPHRLTSTSASQQAPGDHAARPAPAAASRG